MTTLENRLDQLSRAGVLLVGCDFDGTLAPIVESADDARADPESLEALHRLVALPRTCAAIISGRSWRDLDARLPKRGGLILVGSHGSEFEPDIVGEMTPQRRALRREIIETVGALTEWFPGAWAEEKPSGVALHTRACDARSESDAWRAVLDGPGSWPGIFVREGKRIIELSVVASHKGDALAMLRDRLKADGVVFFGDDATDEDAFGVLRESDVGVKVGPGDTRAGFRVASPADVRRLLAYLARQREFAILGGPGDGRA